MSNGYKNGAFALGLTIGSSAVLLLFLLGQHIYDLAKCYHTQQCERSAAKYEGQDFPGSWWWDWTGSLVTSDDTLAQWIMSFFTIAAVILVWRTLSATQEMVADTKQMAADTRDIGQAQVRAYLSIESAIISLMHGDKSPYIKFVVRNSGQSPARKVRIVVKFEMSINSQGETDAIVAEPNVLRRSDIQSGATEDGEFTHCSSEFDFRKFGENFEDLIALRTNVAVFASDVFGGEVCDVAAFIAQWKIADDKRIPIEMKKMGARFLSDDEIEYLRNAANQ